MDSCGTLPAAPDQALAGEAKVLRSGSVLVSRASGLGELCESDLPHERVGDTICGEVFPHMLIPLVDERYSNLGDGNDSASRRASASMSEGLQNALLGKLAVCHCCTDRPDDGGVNNLTGSADFQKELIKDTASALRPGKGEKITTGPAGMRERRRGKHTGHCRLSSCAGRRCFAGRGSRGTSRQLKRMGFFLSKSVRGPTKTSGRRPRLVGKMERLRPLTEPGSLEHCFSGAGTGGTPAA